MAEEIGYIERVIPIKISIYQHSDSKDPQLLKSIKHDLTKYKNRLNIEQYSYWGSIYSNEHKIDSALYFYKEYIQQTKLFGLKPILMKTKSTTQFHLKTTTLINTCV